MDENNSYAGQKDISLSQNDFYRGLWDSKAEQDVFQCLHRIINIESFTIFPHLPISEVIKDFKKYEAFQNTYKKFCKLVNDTDKHDRHFELAHFDFTIYNKSSYFPVLIVEADGTRHKTNPSVIFFDKFKDYVAAQYEIPLVRVELHRQNMDIETRLQDALIGKNLNDPYNYPVYCWKCGQKFLYQPKGAYGSFYYCRSCNKTKTEKSVTLSNNIKNCPPLFMWDI